jgi:LmbE family N-acetylglucosaminyl deacetylase
MHTDSITRRSLLIATGAACGQQNATQLANSITSGRKLKVVVVGAHVDDPQSGCGGTIALCGRLSCDVVALSLTRGDSDSIARSLHMAPEELARKRYEDAIQSCRLLNCRLIALNYVNRSIAITTGVYDKFTKSLLDESPDVVFTHWPVDTHPDHRAVSLLSYNAWLESGRKFPLFFYEVELGRQTQDFFPTHYVEITAVVERKKAAAFANTVTVQGWWPLHEQMQRFRGLEHGCASAEAFNRHPQSPDHPSLDVIAGGTQNLISQVPRALST